MVFTATHIVLTATVTGVVALVVGIWRLPRERWLDTIAAGFGRGRGRAVAPFNMPQLNADGLPSFSANDWARTRDGPTCF